MDERLAESHRLNVLALAEAEKSGRVWDVVLIETGLSKNGNFYPADVLRAAVPLFEGAKASAYMFGNDPAAKFDHVPESAAQANPEGYAGNVVGFYEGISFGPFTRPDGSQGEGILGKLKILEGAEWLAKNLKDAFQNGHPGLLGISIDVKGQARQTMLNGRQINLVEKITAVEEGTVVTEPAAGGGMLRLVASVGDDPMKDFQEFRKLVKEHRPAWLEGFASPDAGTADDVRDHLVRVMEATLARAEEAQRGIPADEVTPLAEVARGVKSIQTMVGLLKENKIQEALGHLRNWIVVHPLKEGGLGPFVYQFEAPDGVKVSVEEPTQEEVVMTESAAEATPAAPVEDTPAVDDSAIKAREEEAAKKEAALAVKEAALMVKERLADSGLPKAGQDRVATLFEGKADVTAETVDEAIKSERDYIASLQEAAPAAKIDGLDGAHADDGSEKPVEVGKEEFDRYVEGWDGFFAGGMEHTNGTKPFRGLKEAWGAITGKWASPGQVGEWIFRSLQLAMPHRMTEGYGAESAVDEHHGRLKESWKSVAPVSLREAITTSDFSVSFGVSFNKRLQKEMAQGPFTDWKKVVSSIENLQDATNTFSLPRIGGQTILPDVNENAPYQEGTDPTEVTETMTPAKKGRLLKLTWEDVLADKVGVLRRIPRILANSSNRTIQQTVFNVIENNTALADAIALVNASHSNLVSGSPALNYVNFVSAVLLLRDQTEQDSSEKLGLPPMFLMTGPKLEAKAIEVLNSAVKDNAAGGEDLTVVNVNSVWGVKPMMSIALGKTTSTDDHWWVMTDPRASETISVGLLGGRETPDIFVQGMDTPTQGSFFDADAITWKVRLVVAATAADYRWIAGSLA